MTEEIVWAKDGRYKDEKKLHDWFKHMKEVDGWIEQNPEGWAKKFFLKWNAAFLFFSDHDSFLMAKFITVKDEIIQEYETWKTKTEEEE